MSEIIRAIESEQLKKDLPKFNVGDTLRVMVKVVEGGRERLQAFEGVCIAKRNGSIRETFTLRLSRCIPRVLIRLRYSAAARSVVRSCTICVICPARPPRLRRCNCAVKTAGRYVRRSFCILKKRAVYVIRREAKNTQGTDSLPRLGAKPQKEVP